MLLSIDVGIKNLAMCMLDESSNTIVQWDVSGIPPEHKDGLYPCFRRHLDEKPWVLEAQTILIEKQPGMNKRMKTVENFLHAYFVIKNPDAETIIYDARHKVPDVCGKGKTLYRKRKQTAITRCKDFLDNSPENSHWIEHFTKSKKKDDLADTVLQALSYGNRIPVKVKAKATKKVVARKPTENQIATKYSKSNLMWIYKNGDWNTKRFLKDLKRYYSSIDELVKEFNG
jgi:hypothetical protein